MEKTLIIGASGGIGSALAAELRARGAQVVGLSRSGEGLDITDEASVDAHLGALEGSFDGIIVASGALEIDGAAPEKTIKAVTARAMADQFAVNAIGPALCILARWRRRLRRNIWAAIQLCLPRRPRRTSCLCWMG